jgi:magnesium chelatase subunit H
MSAYLTAYFGDRLPSDAVEALSSAPGGGAAATAAARAALERSFALSPAGSSGGASPAAPAASPERRADAEAALEEAGRIRDLLMRNTEEIDGVLAGLEGRYVPPEAGGDLLRDGPGVLPTGDWRPAGGRGGRRLVLLLGWAVVAWLPGLQPGKQDADR